MRYMKLLVWQVLADQGWQKNQSCSHSYGVYFAHQTTKALFIPKDIRKVRQFTSYIVVRDAQIVSIFMPPGEDVEICPPPIELSFIESWFSTQQSKRPCPDLSAGAVLEDTGIFHNQCPLSKILTVDGGKDDLCVDHLFLHLRAQCQCVGHEIVH